MSSLRRKPPRLALPSTTDEKDEKEDAPMSRHIAQTWYMDRVVDLPPAIAAVCFDDVRADLCADPANPAGRWSIRADEEVLELAGTGVLSSGQTGWRVLRRLHGSLRSPGGWVRLPVELELLPWSSRRTEVGLRPRGRLGPGPGSFYVRGGNAVLDRLMDELHPAVAWGRWARAFVSRRRSRPRMG